MKIDANDSPAYVVDKDGQHEIKPMQSGSTERDLVTEVENLLNDVGFRGDFETVSRPLLRRLVEEVKRTRQFGCEHCDCSCTNCGPCGEKLP